MTLVLFTVRLSLFFTESVVVQVFGVEVALLYRFASELTSALAENFVLSIANDVFLVSAAQLKI